MIVTADAGIDRLRRRRRRAARPGSCSSGCCAASTRRAAEVVREICETVDFHGGRPWAVEVACWDIAGRAAGEPLWRMLGGRQERIVGLRLDGRAGGAGRARARGPSSFATRACARPRSASTTPTGTTTWPWSRPCGGGRRRDGDHGRREPGLADAGRPRPRWDVGDGGGLRRGARAARRLLARGAAADAPTSRATRRWPSAAAMPDRGRRDGATVAEARDLLLRGGMDVIQCDVHAAGGVAAAAAWPRWPTCTAASGRRTPGRTATAWSRTCTPRADSRRTPTSRCRTIRPPGRRSGATGCCRAVLEIADDGTVAPPPGPGLGVEPDLDELEQWRIA